ncbi:MAG TPA: tyrosine-type recombinase/integrase [Stellaceae bacterium]|nr:tyrosine-type recombinase/integrase [Stellaceae bacterium]
MSGHVRKRSPGSWEIRWRAGGKIRTTTIKAKSQRAAEIELAKCVAAAAIGQFSNAPARLTCADWFDQWHASFSGAPVTLTNYRSVIDRHLKPSLGAIKLRELGPIDIKRMFVELAKTLKPSSLGQIRNVLASSLREAERLDMIPRSPLDRLRGALPIGPSPEARPADKNSIDRAIAALPIGDPRRMALYLALALGLRRGEICGLRWRDVSDGAIMVREQIVPAGKQNITKGPKYGSTREIKIGPKVAEALRQHRLAVAEQLLVLGVRLTTDHPVCAHEDGRALRPGSLTGWCSRHGIRLHGVRHLNASTLIATQPLPIVSARLGHSRPDITLRTYSHVLPGQDDAAAEAIDAAIG